MAAARRSLALTNVSLLPLTSLGTSLVKDSAVGPAAAAAVMSVLTARDLISGSVTIGRAIGGSANGANPGRGATGS